jgi:subtilase family serine protease
MTNLVGIRTLFTGILLAAVWPAITPAQTPTGEASRSIEEARVFTLAGNVHPLARAEFDKGAVAPSTPLDRMMLVLKSSRQQELDALVASQHDPKSPLFHKWLTPAEFGARFGASSADLDRISQWLGQHGFKVEEIPSGKRLVIFSGTAGQVAEAFHTEMHRYTVRGEEHIANAQDPQIPASLAGVVEGIVSLHDFRRAPAMTARRLLGARPQMTSGSSHYLFPADYAVIYDLNSLYSAGTTGTGVSIAIAGRSDINLDDVTQFRSASGLAANSPTVLFEGSDPGIVSGDQDESTLDVEWAGAVAPGAAVMFVTAASTQTSDGIDRASAYIVNHATAPVLSVSYGSCEQDMGSSELAFYNGLWEQAASQGMSAFVASGDSGAAGCEGGSASSGTVTAVNGLCSSPYSTCVGGTEFNEGGNPSQYWSATNSGSQGSALSYIPEQVWNESASNGGSGLWASGGGASVIYQQPAWQQGISGASASNGMRAVPDVALSASGHDGYVIYENGSWWVIAGTSAASPSFAGITALVVQAKGGAGQGNANASFYPLLSAATNPFHATPSGNNSVPGVAGFTASGAAYNMATGLGSVDGAQLVANWGGGTVAGVDFTLSASRNSGTLSIGRSGLLYLSVASTGTSKNPVSLTATAPAGVNVSIYPSSIAPGAQARVILSVTSPASLGTQNIVFTGADASGSQSVTFALTVTPAPTLSLTAASNAVSIAQGASQSVAFTVATGGASSEGVKLYVSGLPDGIAAQWSLNPIPPASAAASTNSTLTFTASATARVATYTALITAAGNGLKSTQTVSVQVLRSPGIEVHASPESLVMHTMDTSTVVVTANPHGGLTAPADAAGTSASVVSGLPAGLTAAWSAPSVTATGAVAWTLTLTGSAAAQAGASQLNLTAQVTDATSGVAYSASRLLNVTLKPMPPTLTASPSLTSVAVVQGGSATDVYTFTAGGSFQGPVSLEVGNLPSGVTASWSANPVTLSSGQGTSTLTLTASATARPVASSIVVRFRGDGLSRDQRIGVQVQVAPGIKVSLSPERLAIHRTKAVSEFVTVTPQGGLSASVVLSVSGLPTGVTATFASAGIAAPGSGTALLTVTGSAQAAKGSNPVIVTATGTDASGNLYTATRTLTLILD